MLFSILADEATNKGGSNWVSYVLLGVLFVILVVSMFIMNRRNKKREQDAQAKIDAVKPGNKVKTIGGICGIVVEVDAEEGTFVLETGTETHGKCYIKFIREAIYDSDAVVEPAATAKNTEAASASVEEKPAETEEPAAATGEATEAPTEKTEEE